MKPFLIILIYLLTTLTAIGQSGVADNNGFTNKAEAKNLTLNGLKEGKWVDGYDELGGYTIDTNKSDFFILTIYKSGKPFGKQKSYYKTGALRSISPYINGKENGIEKEYYESGKLKSETTYANDTIIGVAKEYYENGVVKSETPFLNGEMNGVRKDYYKSGKLYIEAQYKDGKYNGEVKCYYENGKLMSGQIFDNGNEIKQ